MRIAQRRDGVLTYLHGNHLGSIVLETSTSGVEVNDERYFAYGEQRGLGQVNTENQYTDQKRDDTGLYYYGARYYDPSLGTFVSPDTIVPDPTSVLDYNRMMYTRGNPLRYSDPTGHCIFGIDTFVCVAAAVIGAGAAGYGAGRVGFEVGMQRGSSTTHDVRINQVGGALVTDLSDTISAQASSYSIDPLLLSSVIRLESSAIERRIFTLSPSSTPGAVANAAEYTQALIQGGTASVGIIQMQLRRAQELEELGYVTPVESEHERRQALLDPVTAVSYAAGMLRYTSDQLQTLSGYSELSNEDQARLVLIGYNQGWEILQYNVNELGFMGVINASAYDDQTLDGYRRWLEAQQ